VLRGDVMNSPTRTTTFALFVEGLNLMGPGAWMGGGRRTVTDRAAVLYQCRACGALYDARAFQPLKGQSRCRLNSECRRCMDLRRLNARARERAALAALEPEPPKPQEPARRLAFRGSGRRSVW
jgi:hypothetical protein